MSNFNFILKFIYLQSGDNPGEDDDNRPRIVMSNKRAYTDATYISLAETVVKDKVAYHNVGKNIHRHITGPLVNGVITSPKGCPGKDTTECAVVFMAMNRDLYLAEKMASSTDLFVKFDGEQLLCNGHAFTHHDIVHKELELEMIDIIGLQGWGDSVKEKTQCGVSWHHLKNTHLDVVVPLQRQSW